MMNEQAECGTCADNLILNVLMFTGMLREHWYFTTWHFTSLFIEKLEKVQITEILNVGKV